MTPSTALRRSVCTFVVAAGFAACSNGGGGGVPVAATPTILRSDPADGATDVEPDVELTIDMALPVGGSPDGDITVGDGVHVLPGTFAYVGGATWRWTPQAELPRGSEVVLASRTQGPVARFTVREAATRRGYEVSDMEVERVVTWPNGRTAVFGDGRWFEVTANGLVERFTNMTIGALPYGDGLAVFTELDASQQRWLVRTGLAGERERVLMPVTAVWVDVNERGDVATFTRENTTFPGQGGFWLLPGDGFVFDRVAAFATFYSLVPRIAEDGSISAAWGEQQRVRLVRIAAGSQVIESYEEPAVVPQPRWDVAADGSGWLLWVERDEPRFRLLGRRYEPGVGLAAVVELETWEPGPGFAYVQCDESRAGLAGSTILELNVSGVGSAYRQFVRIERDGWISIPNAYAATTFTRKLVQSPVRSETWGMLRSVDGKELSFARSRPGSQSELDRLLYRIPEPSLQIGEFHAAVDDGGRATVAFEVDGLGLNQRVIRVIVFE